MQCMPLYHSAAACLGFSAALFTGATAAIGRKFSTKAFWKEVRETNSTIIQYVGETCRYLAVAPPETDPVTGENLDKKHRVRAAIGNGLRPDVWDRFKERFGIEVSLALNLEHFSSLSRLTDAGFKPEFVARPRILRRYRRFPRVVESVLELTWQGGCWSIWAHIWGLYWVAIRHCQG